MNGMKYGMKYGLTKMNSGKSSVNGIMGNSWDNNRKNMGGSINGGYPKNGWFTMGNDIKMDDVGDWI